MGAPLREVVDMNAGPAEVEMPAVPVLPPAVVYPAPAPTIRRRPPGVLAMRAPPWLPTPPAPLPYSRASAAAAWWWWDDDAGDLPLPRPRASLPKPGPSLEGTEEVRGPCTAPRGCLEGRATALGGGEDVLAASRSPTARTKEMEGGDMDLSLPPAPLGSARG